MVEARLGARCIGGRPLGRTHPALGPIPSPTRGPRRADPRRAPLLRQSCPPHRGAVAALPPGAPPSSENRAATTLPAAGSTATGLPPIPPGLSIPVTSSATLANAPPAAYPNAANALADKLTSAPSATTKATTPALSTASLPTLPPGSATSQPIAAASAPPSAGPYDPKAYKPSAALASSGTDPIG